MGKMCQGCQERQERLLEFYQELSGEVTEELEKISQSRREQQIN